MSLDGAIAAQGNPKDWPVATFGKIVRQRKEFGREDLPLLGVSVATGVRPRFADDGRPAASLDLSGYKVVHTGDVVMNALGKPHGSIGRSAIEGITSPAYWVLAPTAEIDSRFLHYLLRSHHLINEYQRLGKYLPPNQFDLPWDSFRNIGFPLPPMNEQRQIADFLDDQVTRIDQAIHLRKRQIDLMEARRRAALVECLFGNGIATKPVSAAAIVQLGRQRSPENATGDYMTPYLRSANVKDGQLLLEDVKLMNFTPEERRVFALVPGDILVTEGAGSPESVGSAAIYRGDLAGDVCFQNTLLRLRPRDGTDVEYLYWWARAAYAAGAMRTFASGANILHIGSDGLKRMPVPIRSLADQAEAAFKANQQSAIHEALGESISRSVELLDERKRSLITAAVTGEFDVSSASSRAAGVASSGV